MSEILVLAITMMAGPQIITAVLLITSKRAVAASLGFIAGIAFATLTGSAVFYSIAKLFSLSDPATSHPSHTALVIQSILVGLLIVLAIKKYIGRKTSVEPKWMASLVNASPKTAFKTALTLIYLMPGDIIMMSIVGINLASHSTKSYPHLMPFVALTTLIGSIPLLTFLIFHKRAVKAMPKIRAWLETNSWAVSVAVYLVFVYLLWP